MDPRLVELLGQDDRRVGLARAAHSQDRERLSRRLQRQREIRCNHERLGRHPLAFSFTGRGGSEILRSNAICEVGRQSRLLEAGRDAPP
jgi:hypothetical protein